MGVRAHFPVPACHLLLLLLRREERFTTEFAARIAAPADAPRFSMESRTCCHCLFSLGVVALRVCLLAGIGFFLAIAAAGRRLAVRVDLSFNLYNDRIGNTPWHLQQCLCNDVEVLFAQFQTVCFHSP